MDFYRRQIKTVLLIELLIIAVLCLISFGSLHGLCGTSWQSCLGNPDYALSSFFMLSIVRPLLIWPNFYLSLAAGDAFGPVMGTLLMAFGSMLSTLVVYLPGIYLGKKLVQGWLSSNLPETYRLMKTQDYKIVFITRLIPVFPFDLCSLLYGVAGFRPRSVILATLIGVLPEAFLFARLPGRPDSGIIANTFESLLIFAGAVLVPLLFYEFLSRKSGSSLWNRSLRMYRELVYEIQTNNDIAKQRVYHNRSTPVILLYGFFSSRRALTVIERQLTSRGMQVMSFNLGGLLGVFFTRGIPETAAFLDQKIRRQIERNGFQKVHIVGHSKGGLVALWWLLMHGGEKYCDRLITLGTPYRGSILTYLALITPLGLFWRDVWQMRPGSEFIKRLHALKIPDHLKIFCFFSDRDRVARGTKGLFRPQTDITNVTAVPMHHVSHFEFLYRRDVGDHIAKILKEANTSAEDSGVDGHGAPELVDSDLVIKKLLP